MLIFTCAVTRTCHLELVEDMTVAEFLEAFSSFCCCRGIPSVCYSDNAKTYVATKKKIEHRYCDVIYDAINDPKMLEKKVQWKFIPQRAPWWGGWWEKLIGLMKSHIRKSLGKGAFTKNQL